MGDWARESFDRQLNATLETPEVQRGLDAAYRDMDHLRSVVRESFDDIVAAAAVEEAEVERLVQQFSDETSKSRRDAQAAAEELYPTPLADVSRARALLKWAVWLHAHKAHWLAVAIVLSSTAALLWRFMSPALLDQTPVSPPSYTASLLVLASGILLFIATIGGKRAYSKGVDAASQMTQSLLADRANYVEQRTRTDSRLMALKQRVDSARTRLDEAVVQKGILEFAREYLNNLSEESYSLELAVESAPGLSESGDLDFEVSTQSADRLNLLMSQVSGGTFGIAGPRGAGKTTLIRSFCIGRRREGRNAVMISAPVEYASREFLLHLFAELCKLVLGDAVNEPDPIQREALPPYKRLSSTSVTPLLITFGAILTAIGSSALSATFIVTPAPWRTIVIWAAMLFAIGAALLLLALRSARRHRARLERHYAEYGVQRDHDRDDVSLGKVPGETIRGLASAALLGAGAAIELQAALVLVLGRLDWPVAAPELAAGTVVVLGVSMLGAALVWNRWDRRSLAYAELSSMNAGYQASEYSESTLRSSGISERARAHLRDIKFQQSFTSGWAGAIRAPVPLTTLELQASLNGATTLAAHQKSLPDVVAEIRVFLRDLAVETPIVVGIDELDKLEADDRARSFINELKAVFSIPRCYFLVSVSEDALASFERRGLPFRDVFDSAFDEIVTVPYLSLEDAKRVISRRVIGLPIPFMCLSYCLSGGLARDLIRATRNVVRAGAETSGALSSIASNLVEVEIEGKTNAVVAAIKTADLEPEVSRLLGWVQLLRRDRLSAVTGLTKPPWSGPERPQSCISRRFRGEVTRNMSDAERAKMKSLVRLTQELAGFYYFADTLEAVFSDSLEIDKLQVAERGDTSLSFEGLVAHAKLLLSAPSSPGTLSAVSGRRGV